MAGELDITEYDENPYGENPDPAMENYLRFLSDNIFLNLENPSKSLCDKVGDCDKGEGFENILKLAFKPFSPLGPGEIIGKGEIHRRLALIRKAGYPVKPYSTLNSNESWKYLTKIRGEVVAKAKRCCPEVLEQIRKENSKSDNYL